ncbi:ChrR family anti-sigma-E factor [Shewanella sp. SR44-3]|uniref:ChrR family anti-sigma-E factor n=1 Tax=Shewanella sp. SR44-3 TaxID=2760936 RepID=UPI0015FAECBA|nr:ChrR family anti-sigma-E factor [Shewanella sp. SR44-3]MBB1269319.1 cupin domain-containing protein [Shewanella sp. SR44-3]
MINHHPNTSILVDFVAGELPASISIMIASHMDFCRQCRQQVQVLTEQAAALEFEPLADSLSQSSQTDNFDIDHAMSMIEAITESDIDTQMSLPQTVTEIAIGKLRIPLPRAIKSVALKEWQGLGKLSRARLDVQDDERRMSLLYIAPGGSVPCHTHQGFEITLLLQGSFEDEMGQYHQGDFIWLDGKHTHQPVTTAGCVCLTVSSDAIRFTQGMSQLLNPIGKFIY